MKYSALAFALSALVFPARATAHVLDQYLQVTQLALAPEHIDVELRLIPGVQIADRVFAQIDTNDDGLIAHSEEQAYARNVMHELTLAVDGRQLPLTLVNAQFPSRSDMREGVGVIRLQLTAKVSLSAVGQHRIDIRNDYQREIGAYLVNVLVPTSDSLRITRQTRDPLQHQLQLDIDMRPPVVAQSHRSLLIWLLALSVLLWSLRRLRRVTKANAGG